MHSATLRNHFSWPCSSAHVHQSIPVLRLHPRQYHRWTVSDSGCTNAQASAGQASSEAPAASVVSSRHGDLAWASCVSSQPSVSTAIQEAVDCIHQHQQDGGFQPNLAIVFASCNYGSQLQDVVAVVRRAVPSVRYIFGCTAFGVLGSSSQGAVEVEGEPGISFTLAALPGVELSVLHTLRSSIPSEDASPEAWSDLVGMSQLEQLQLSQQTSPAGSGDENSDDSGSDEEHQQQQQEEEEEEEKDQQQLLKHRSAAAESQQVGAIDTPKDELVNQQPASQPQHQPSEAISFLVLCDPRFQQSKQLLAGLDFAFPDSNKVGAVLSQGQQNKRRLMFVWSADGPVQTGTAAWQHKQQRRRQQQRQRLGVSGNSSSLTQVEQQVMHQQPPREHALAAAELQQQPVQQQNPDTGSSSNSQGKKRGLFGNLFDSLVSGLNEGSQQQLQSRSGSRQHAAAAAARVPAEFEVISSQPDASDSDDEDAVNSSGVFMYGAAVLAMKGPVSLEPLTCQGYRTVSDKVWTIGQTSRDADLIATLIDPEPDDEGEEGAEVVPLIAVHELMVAAGFNEQLEESPEQWIESLSSSLAVAIAPDSWRPDTELQQDDFQVCAISEVWQRTGYIRIVGQARPGYRLRLVLRDEVGIRDDLSNKLLGLKRAELAGVLSGNKQPPPLGAMLFSDIGRGVSLYETPNYESGTVCKFLPAPLSGMFGSAQISTVNKKAALYELASTIGVVRPLIQREANKEKVEAAEQQ